MSGQWSSHWRSILLDCLVGLRASDDRNERNVDTPADGGSLLVVSSAVALTVVTGLCFTVWQEDISDFLFEQSMSPSAAWGAGDVAGGVLWGLSLWYCSPLQLLLLFLGQVDTERPSDWVLRVLGQAAGLPVTSLDYTAPWAVQAVAAALFAGAGLGVAGLWNSGLGDATWSVSTGLGACMAAFVYEVGRPRRLGVEEAQRLEGQWQDFAAWSSVRLQRAGRCHESEVFKAFRKAHAKYRTAEAISDAVLRDMVRNWHPSVERTPNGFYRNLSLAPTVDAWTGAMQGPQLPGYTPPPTPPAQTSQPPVTVESEVER
ncbi:hypothetical protein QJQ45_008154 [Haematococcus lacustris]|nr:hypothetical protein QJQ45_008154 [Haematococcus lacustris]